MWSNRCSWSSYSALFLSRSILQDLAVINLCTQGFEIRDFDWGPITSRSREKCSLSLCSLYQGKILTETERDIGRGFFPPRFNSLWDLSDRMYVGVWALKAKIRPKCLMDFISVSISFLTQWSFFPTVEYRVIFGADLGRRRMCWKVCIANPDVLFKIDPRRCELGQIFFSRKQERERANRAHFRHRDLCWLKNIKLVCKKRGEKKLDTCAPLKCSQTKMQILPIDSIGRFLLIGLIFYIQKQKESLIDFEFCVGVTF